MRSLENQQNQKEQFENLAGKVCLGNLIKSKVSQRFNQILFIILKLIQ